MKHGYYKGNKVAECQDSQTSLMDRFKKQGIVDEWREVLEEEKQFAKAEVDKPAKTETAPPPVKEPVKAEAAPSGSDDKSAGELGGGVFEGIGSNGADKIQKQKEPRGGREK